MIVFVHLDLFWAKPYLSRGGGRKIKVNYYLNTEIIFYKNQHELVLIWMLDLIFWQISIEYSSHIIYLLGLGHLLRHTPAAKIDGSDMKPNSNSFVIFII